MQADPRRTQAPPAAAGPEWTNEERDGTAAATGAEHKHRLAHLAHAIEHDVIPRLVRSHRPAANPGEAAAAPALDAGEVQRFTRTVLRGEDTEVGAAIAAQRARGIGIDALYLELLAPTARLLGQMWEDDLCDFSSVTVALGRLQRLLRELSPAFGAEVEHPPHGRRALFVQPRDEQHSFGLSMVAEFFRRDGWDVIGGVGGAIADPAALVGEVWVDVLGFSIGSDTRLAWLHASVAAARAATRNPDLVIMVGGPPFIAHPELAQSAGADGTARDGREAPRIAEQLLASRANALAAV